jgi:hypothetical protein
MERSIFLPPTTRYHSPWNSRSRPLVHNRPWSIAVWLYRSEHRWKDDRASRSMSLFDCVLFWTFSIFGISFNFFFNNLLSINRPVSTFCCRRLVTGWFQAMVEGRWIPLALLIGQTNFHSSRWSIFKGLSDGSQNYIRMGDDHQFVLDFFIFPMIKASFRAAFS